MTTMHSLSIVLAALLVTATAVLLAHGDDQAGALDRFPRVRLAHLPPPLEEMGRLSAELGGPRLLIKRDDQTGLAFGGNKARKLEYIFADVLAKQADVVITYAGQQSNWARQTAAAARKFGIQPILVLRKVAVGEVAFEGNLLLDEILDADVRLIEPDESREEMVEEIAATERKKGRTPYVVSVGGSRTEGSMTRPLGAVAYAKGFQELYEQARTQNVRITHVVAATGSGGTQAGLLVGAKALDADVEIVGISVSGKNPAVEQTVLDLATQTSDALGLDTSNLGRRRHRLRRLCGPRLRDRHQGRR